MVGKQVASVAVDIRTLLIGLFATLPIRFFVLSNQHLGRKFLGRSSFSMKTKRF